MALFISVNPLLQVFRRISLPLTADETWRTKQKSFCHRIPVCSQSPFPSLNQSKNLQGYFPTTTISCRKLLENKGYLTGEGSEKHLCISQTKAENVLRSLFLNNLQANSCIFPRNLNDYSVSFLMATKHLEKRHKIFTTLRFPEIFLK